MAKALSFVSVDTPISGVTTNPIELGKVNYGADFVEKTNAKKGEVIITNTKAPVGLSETFRFSISQAEDVYKGSEIDPSYRNQSKKGVSVLIQSSLVMKETDSGDATYLRYVPIKIHTVMLFPSVESLTEANCEELFRRHASSFYNTGEHGTGRFGQIVRGALLPLDVK